MSLGLWVPLAFQNLREGVFLKHVFNSNNLEFFICNIAVCSFSVQRRRKAVCGQMDQSSVKLNLASKIEKILEAAPIN